MSESYKKILDSCQEFGKTAQSDNILNNVAWARTALEEKHIPTATVAEMGLDVVTLFQFVSAFCDENYLKTIGEKLPRTPMCVTFEKGERIAFYRVSAEGTEAVSAESVTESADVAELVITVPAKRLNGMKLILMIGVKDPEIWKPIIDETDTLCLRTNATMAMTLDEKKWIEEIASKRFGQQNLGIWVDKINLLNNDSDINDVKDVIRTVLAKCSISAQQLYSQKETIDYAAFTASDKAVSTSRSKRIVRNLLNDCSGEISLILNSGQSDPGDAAKAISCLESSKKRIKIAGQIAAQTTFANTMNGLCMRVKESARDYNAQIRDNILKKLNNTGDKELEAAVDKIGLYISGVWSYYASEISRLTKPDIEAIFDQVVSRMEEDAGALYAEMDDGSINVIRDSFRSNGNDLFNIGMVSSGTPEIDTVNPINELKRNTRTEMLVSVPLVLFNPFIAFASFATSGFVGKAGRKRAVADYRNQIISQVEGICGNVLSEIIKNIDAGFDNAVKESSDNIIKAYNGIIDRIVGQVKEVQEKQAMLQKRRSSLETAINTAIPEMLRTI